MWHKIKMFFAGIYRQNITKKFLLNIVCFFVGICFLTFYFLHLFSIDLISIQPVIFLLSGLGLVIFSIMLFQSVIWAKESPKYKADKEKSGVGDIHKIASEYEDDLEKIIKMNE
jgi:hypothetical protein